MKNLINLFKQSVPHIHNWILVAKTYAPPIKALTVEMAQDPVVLQRVLFGLTTFLWECDSCVESKKEDMLGSDVDTLEQLLEKVEIEGAQTIKKEGGSYLIGRIPASEPEALPIR